ncbi:hypothetical protein EK904_002317 [Melospiza melodia maxima]|nr:hypothetical protein EK904_002317 [Melospiza melodia maxima]
MQRPFQPRRSAPGAPCPALGTALWPESCLTTLGMCYKKRHSQRVGGQDRPLAVAVHALCPAASFRLRAGRSLSDQ